MKRFLMGVMVFCALQFTPLACFGAENAAVTDEQAAETLDFYAELDGEAVEFKAPIVTVGDLTYIPLRELCDKLNIEVNCLAESKTAALKSIAINENAKIQKNDETLFLSDFMGFKELKSYGDNEREMFLTMLDIIAETAGHWDYCDMIDPMGYVYELSDGNSLIFKIGGGFRLQTADDVTAAIPLNEDRTLHIKLFSEVSERLSAEKADVSITLDGKETSFDFPVMTINNTTYISALDMSDIFGADLKLISESRKELEEKGDSYFEEYYTHSLYDFDFLTFNMDMQEIYDKVGQPSYYSRLGSSVYRTESGIKLRLSDNGTGLLKEAALETVDGVLIPLSFKNDGSLNLNYSPNSKNRWVSYEDLQK